MNTNPAPQMVGEPSLKQEIDIAAEIRNLFSLATFITLEPGMTNSFSEGLEEAIEKYGELALREIQELVVGEVIPFTIAAEALRYIGNTESIRFVSKRRELLEVCLLQSRFMLVRDGAAAGLSYLDDPRSIPSLQRAIEREPHAELKNDLIEVLSLLQGTSAE
ncbi:MAG: HEAT repeat domain-containing protein [Chloroflexi bacterium]|nr:HEAT repeat domain-containing protein [Chloroflexota bacterium]